MAEASLELIQLMLVRVQDTLNRHSAEFSDMRKRLANVERGVAALRREFADDAHISVGLQDQIDHLKERALRIERRLEISDA